MHFKDKEFSKAHNPLLIYFYKVFLLIRLRNSGIKISDTQQTYAEAKVL
jgi:hypothetical protein